MSPTLLSSGELFNIRFMNGSLIFFCVMSYSLGDRDDDVRSVAASCLLPVAAHLVEQLPESLDRVLIVLWNCLSDMKDDLSSSVGAVMDLLGSINFFCLPRLY
jgi:hypothetical protein